MNKYIVLDINHGGDYLASLLKLRRHEVIVYDIYQTRGEKRKKLDEQNIKIINSIDRDYRDYIIVYPIHCPDKFVSSFSSNKKMTHHELVKFLFRSDSDEKTLIEITGSKGKTTTANILAYLLSFGDNVFLNSSRGFENYVHGHSTMINEKNSISPGFTANILSESYSGLHIFEESLGTSGLGDISILTSTSPMYKIKSGDGNSLEAKTQLFNLSEGQIIIDGKDKIARDLADKYGKEVFRIWEDVRIELPDYLEIGKDVYSNINYEDLELRSKFSGNYLLAGYLNPILFGVMALKILKKDLRKTSKYLSEFNGVEKRLSVIKENGFTKIIDKSGGFSEESLSHLFYLLKHNYDMFYKNINLLIDLDNKSHCQKIDILTLDKVIGEFGNLIDNAFLLGKHDFERFKYLKDSTELNIKSGDLLIECGT